MRLLLTGQIGLDKKQYLAEVAALAAAHGEGGPGGLKIYNIGEMMYQEAPDVPAGRILDLPLSRLNSLRRAVFRDILADAPSHKHIIVNTHATFRWKHGLFAAFDFDQLALLNADLYVCLVDNIESVHARLLRDTRGGSGVDHSLKDLMVWREEEILATEILAKANGPQMMAQGRTDAAGGHPKFYVLSRGRHPASTAETLFRLLFRPQMKKVYPSFPMSHVGDLPAILAEINAFRAAIAQRFIAFDPGDVDEKLLADSAIRAAQVGQQTLTIRHPAPAAVAGGTGSAMAEDPSTLSLKVSDLLSILPDIDGQIYARDFILVRQADLIISYIPELPPPPGSAPGTPGKPALSSGVERELQHAYDHGRETYIIWKPRKEPSPFITQTATRVFRTTEEALAYFEARGYFHPHSLF
jgi:adenylate kinase